MFKNKKFFQWSLSLLAITAPIVTVIACSNPEKNKDDQNQDKIFADLTSKEAINMLEIEWLNMVIQTFDKDFNNENAFNNESVKKIAKFLIAEELKKDSLYLSKKAKLLLSIVNSENKKSTYKKEDLISIGFLKDYLYGYDDDFFQKESTIFDRKQKNINWITETLIKEPSLAFLNEIYKYKIVTEYLKITKQEYQEYMTKNQNKDYKFTETEDLINNGKNFLLIKKLLEKRLFFEWEIKEKNNENRFIDGDNKLELEKALKHFILSQDGTSSIADHSGYLTQKEKLNRSIWDFGDTITLQVNGKSVEIKLHAYLGYKGIVSHKKEEGYGRLDFSIPELKKSTKDYWIGILKNKDNLKELISKDINLNTTDENKVASLKFIFGIMPVIDKDGKLTMAGSHFENNIDSVAWLLYSNDKNNIYNEALTFFTSDKNKGGKEIRVKVSVKEILKHLKEVEKLLFVQLDE